MTDSRKTCSYSQQKNPRNCSLYPIEKEKNDKNKIRGYGVTTRKLT